jgi:hypothetical protein
MAADPPPRSVPPAKEPKTTTADAAIDSLLRESVGDVDQSLLDWALSLAPRQRLRASHRAAVALARFRHG